MRGPPPKPTYLRILEGNPSKRPLNRNEPQPPPVETLDPPDYLGGHAATEWCRIVPGLSAMRLLTIADIQNSDQPGNCLRGQRQDLRI